MLKTSKNTESMTWLRKGIVEIGSDSRVGYDKNELNISEIDDGEVDGNKVNDKIGKKRQKTSKFKNFFKSKKLSKSKKTLGSDFLIFRTKLVFTKLRQTFIKSLILYHFDLKRHIQIETDASGYVISRVLG